MEKPTSLPEWKVSPNGRIGPHCAFFPPSVSRSPLHFLPFGGASTTIDQAETELLSQCITSRLQLGEAGPMLFLQFLAKQAETPELNSNPAGWMSVEVPLKRSQTDLGASEPEVVSSHGFFAVATTPISPAFTWEYREGKPRAKEALIEVMACDIAWGRISRQWFTPTELHAHRAAAVFFEEVPLHDSPEDEFALWRRTAREQSSSRESPSTPFQERSRWFQPGVCSTLIG